jgi:hypothetical protein
MKVFTFVTPNIEEDYLPNEFNTVIADTKEEGIDLLIEYWKNNDYGEYRIKYNTENVYLYSQHKIEKGVMNSILTTDME